MLQTNELVIMHSMFSDVFGLPYRLGSLLTCRRQKNSKIMLHTCVRKRLPVSSMRVTLHQKVKQDLCKSKL